MKKKYQNAKPQKIHNGFLVNMNIIDLNVDKEVFKAKGVPVKKFKSLWDELYEKFK